MATHRKFDRNLLVLHSSCKSVNIALNPHRIRLPKECQVYPPTVKGYLRFVGGKMSGEGTQASMMNLAERNGLLVEITLTLEDDEEIVVYSHNLFAAMQFAIDELRERLLVV